MEQTDKGLLKRIRKSLPKIWDMIRRSNGKTWLLLMSLLEELARYDQHPTIPDAVKILLKIRVLLGKTEKSSDEEE